jgi:predicted anti-sigma-YlaC factor YlaD
VRRIQTALDDDHDGRLSLRDLDRIVAHVAACRRCRTIAADYRRLAESLARLAARHPPDPAALHRLRRHATALTTRESA